MRVEFNLREWNHGYLGVILILIDAIWLNWWFVRIIGAILVLDEVTQIFIFGQYGGLVHHLYKPLYKNKWIRKLNEWLDRLFGKRKVNLTRQSFKKFNNFLDFLKLCR